MSRNNKPCCPGGKPLEITMRDVMDGLLDAATHEAYGFEHMPVQILSIELPRQPVDNHQQQTAKILPVSTQRSQNIVDYLIQRENARVSRAG